MAKPKCTDILCGALNILQVLFALVVVGVTSWKLVDVDISAARLSSACALGKTDPGDTFDGSKLCVYAIAVGVVSLLVSIVLACIRNVVKCVTLNACGANKIVAVIGDAALAVWWGIAFAIVLSRGRAANAAGFEERAARDGVIAATFGAMAAFALDAVITIFDLVL